MPRKLIAALSELRVSDTTMHNNFLTLAPLPVEESDPDSPTGYVPPAIAGIAIAQEGVADATMKDEADEEEEGDDDDDDDDPETSA